MLVVDDVLGVQVGLEAEGLVVVHAEFGQMLLGNAAGGQNLLHVLLGDHQGFRHFALLVQLDALAQLVVNGLHHVQTAIISQ